MNKLRSGGVIKINENDHVDGRIQECIQAQRASSLEEFAPTKNVIKRSARQGKDKQRNGMSPGPLFQGLDRIGGQMMIKIVDNQAHKGRPPVNVDGDLKRGVALKKRFH